MTTEEELVTIQRGQAARLLRSDAEDTLLGYEEDIIQRLVLAYRHGSLTNDQLRGSIGEIAGIRWFREDLESRIRKGTMTAEVSLNSGEDYGERSPE